MGVEAGVAYVDLVPRLAPGATAAVNAQASRLGATTAARFSAAGRGLTAALTVPVLAVGAAAVGSFMAVDDGLDTIQTRTGATGKAMDGLEAVFARVGKRVPSSLGDVGEAVGQLAQRTDLSGNRLANMAEQVLNLSRLTGEDLGGIITGSTRLFGDWSVATNKQSGMLDYLFRVSQRTGVPVNALSASLVRFGAPLRQLGFGLEESAALLGSFEREGVNANLVMGSMRIALGQMARDGEPAQATLARVTDEIKNAGSTSEANAIALELFGARAGPDMAAAIREGRFELGNMVGDLRRAPGTINAAAAATDDLPERFGRLRNRITLALAPLGAMLVTAAERAMPYIERLIGFVQGLAARFQRLSPTIRTVVGAIIGIGAALGPVFLVVGAVLPSLIAGFQAFGAAIAIVTGPVGLVVLAIAALVAGLVIAYNRSERFREIVQTAFEWLRTNVPPIVEAVKARVIAFAQAVAAKFGELVGWVRQRWGAIKEAITRILTVIKAIVGANIAVIAQAWRMWGDDLLNIIRNIFNIIKSVIRGTLEAIGGIIDVVLGIITGDWGRVWDGIKAIVGGVWRAITGVIRGALGIVRSILGAAMSAVRSLFRGAWNAVTGIVRGAWNLVVSSIRGGWQRARAIVAAIPGAVRGIAGRMFSSIGDAARNGINTAVNFVKALPGRIREVIGRAAEAANAVGAAVLRGIGNGLSAVVGFVGDVAGAIGNAIRGAINGLIDLLNAGIPNSLGWGRFSIDIPDNPIPRLHTGGRVPGMVGEERMVKLKAGEDVVRTAAQQRLTRGPGAEGVTLMFPAGGDRHYLAWLRHVVRVEGAGDVQVALGQGR